jgi:hypothetical protein
MKKQTTPPPPVERPTVLADGWIDPSVIPPPFDKLYYTCRVTNGTTKFFYSIGKLTSLYVDSNGVTQYWKDDCHDDIDVDYYKEIVPPFELTNNDK